ncbi:hypothetical protein [Dulcicalothrix desertica]|nr:hypothetical protein [Dulcicalothrix desertica]
MSVASIESRLVLMSLGVAVSATVPNFYWLMYAAIAINNRRRVD